MFASFHMRIMFQFAFLFILPAVAHLQPRQTATIPDFVNKYAPLVYLDQNDLYLPSEIQAQLNNTIPEVKFKPVTNAPSPLLLSNLDQLNSAANCTADQSDSCSIYLTSKEDVTTNPAWLYGVLPDTVTYQTVGIKSCAIIVNDHGNGVVDAFYMYFYAFNLGLTVLKQLLDDHVGDWEHTMVRFTNGTPTTMWYSQHDAGQIFTYEAVSKNGMRPIVYSAIGSHANFAVPGTHTRVIGGVNVNDFTSPGPLWDPTLSAYYYTFTPTSKSDGVFTPSDASFPTAWLHFLGGWGDQRYPDSDPRQVNFLNASIEWKYENGPTGPLDKDLNRTGTCPGSASLCTTLTTLPATSGSSIPVTVTRTSSTAGSTTTVPSTTGSSRPSSATSQSAGSASPSTADAARGVEQSFFVVMIGVLSFYI